MSNQWKVRPSVVKRKQHQSTYFLLSCKAAAKKACELPEATKRTSVPEVQEVIPVFFKEEELSVPTALVLEYK